MNSHPTSSHSISHSLSSIVLNIKLPFEHEWTENKLFCKTHFPATHVYVRPLTSRKHWFYILNRFNILFSPEFSGMYYNIIINQSTLHKRFKNCVFEPLLNCTSHLTDTMRSNEDSKLILINFLRNQRFKRL